jgi:hypothetical protein
MKMPFPEPESFRFYEEVVDKDPIRHYKYISYVITVERA